MFVGTLGTATYFSSAATDNIKWHYTTVCDMWCRTARTYQ